MNDVHICSKCSTTLHVDQSNNSILICPTCGETVKLSTLVEEHGIGYGGGGGKHTTRQNREVRAARFAARAAERRAVRQARVVNKVVNLRAMWPLVSDGVVGPTELPLTPQAQTWLESGFPCHHAALQQLLLWQLDALGHLLALTPVARRALHETTRRLWHSYLATRRAYLIFRVPGRSPVYPDPSPDTRAPLKHPRSIVGLESMYGQPSLRITLALLLIAGQRCALGYTETDLTTWVRFGLIPYLDASSIFANTSFSAQRMSVRELTALAVSPREVRSAADLLDAQLDPDHVARRQATSLFHLILRRLRVWRAPSVIQHTLIALVTTGILPKSEASVRLVGRGYAEDEEVAALASATSLLTEPQHLRAWRDTVAYVPPTARIFSTRDTLNLPAGMLAAHLRTVDFRNGIHAHAPFGRAASRYQLHRQLVAFQRAHIHKRYKLLGLKTRPHRWRWQSASQQVVAREVEALLQRTIGASGTSDVEATIELDFTERATTLREESEAAAAAAIAAAREGPGGPGGRGGDRGLLESSESTSSSDESSSSSGEEDVAATRAASVAQLISVNEWLRTLPTKEIEDRHRLDGLYREMMNGLNRGQNVPGGIGRKYDLRICVFRPTRPTPSWAVQWRDEQARLSSSPRRPA